jgi:hypothetical protein
VISRSAVAETLVRAAVGGPRTLPSTVLAAAAADVVSRVAALDGPAPRLRIGRASLLIGVLATAAVAVGYGMHDTEHLFELAQAAWRARHH